MKTVIRPFMLTGLLIALAGCGIGFGDKFYDYQTPTPPDMEVLMLSQCLVGSFSSAEQAAKDADYHDITLETVRVWPTRGDGVWLYVEQAAAESKDKPYRQRIYHLTRRNDVTFSSEIYTLPDEAAMVGAWRDPTRFDALSPADLVVKEGCAVELERVNAWMFSGSTREQDCPSELQGASYATSEVTITPSWIESWDRGFDEADNQVWGAIKGAYRFVKQGR
ncbi:chromophore lyase CpcT/CpeT [bacterium]|nr:chromophore lyase CpcT/CpeT [bacterium]MBU1074124.1 chromophore lyase CpcT/CpeT [bacterium]MBU1675052.1 chromophore lyase CpcT/CpeT [bacterium]